MRIEQPPLDKISGITIDADIPMAGYKLTGLGAGSGAGHSVRYEQAILQALLTTQGDIIVRGAAIAERFAKPATGKYLRTTATGYEGVDPPVSDYSLLSPMLTEETPSTWDFNDSINDRRLCHSIRYVEAVTITQIGLVVKDKAGTPSDLYVEIWDDSSGNPNVVITNGSKSMAQADVLAEEINWFKFATAPTLTANTLYWIVVRQATKSGTDYYSFYVFDGIPYNGRGVWGFGTIGRVKAAAWGTGQPPITIIQGRRA